MVSVWSSKGKFAKLRPCCQSLETSVLSPEHFLIITRLLDTAIRCFSAIRVGITIAEKMAVRKL